MPHSPVYTPSRESADALRERTVGRERVLARLGSTLRSAATSHNRSHTLLKGPRGSGKTHLLTIVADDVRRDPVLSERLVLVTVPEDAIGITRLDDLLDLSLTALGEQQRSVTDRQERIRVLLGDRVLLLVLENLDRVMRALGPAGRRAFRAWVETSGNVLVVASTSFLFAGVSDRDEPWFGAFDVLDLVDLTPDEGYELLLGQARAADDRPLVEFLDNDTGRARVRALSELTGGSPRIWMIVADVLHPDRLDQLIPTVEDLLERLTPHYQQLLLDLAPNEQRIVRALAESGRYSLTVTELAEAAGLPTGISTQLRRLVDERWLSSIVSSRDRRHTLYRFRDPLLWLHLRHRSGDRVDLRLVVVSILEAQLEHWGTQAGPRLDAVYPAVGTLDPEVAMSVITRQTPADLAELVQAFDAVLADSEPPDGTSPTMVVDWWRARRGDADALHRLPDLTRRTIEAT